MQQAVIANAAQAIHWADLGLNPIALDLGFLQIHWYSLAYIAGILLGWYYLTRLIAQPGAPMARRHADDLVFYATLGILIGGRLAYVFFYQPDILLHPLDVLKLYLRQYVERAILTGDAQRGKLLTQVEKLRTTGDIERLADELSEFGAEPF